MKPFIHLDIPYGIKPWKHHFDRFDIKQNLNLQPSELLEDTTLQFLNSNGLKAKFANIWSWLPGTYPIWHIDQQDARHSIVAINYLLEGDAGQTEWIGFEKTKQIRNDSIDSVYGTLDQRFISINKADFTESIRPGTPMMIRTDIPHRVIRAENSNIRWTARIFIQRLDSDLPLQWDEAVKILGQYEVIA